MIIITKKELERNYNKYLELSNEQNIYIKKNNKVVSVLIKKDIQRMMWDSLVGCAKSEDEKTLTLDEIREERLSKYFYS